MGPAGPGGPGGPGRAIVDEPSETQTHTLAHIQIYTHIQRLRNQSIVKESHFYCIYILPTQGVPVQVWHTAEMNLESITKNRENPPKAEVFDLSQHYIPALMTFPGAPGSPMKRKRQRWTSFLGEDLWWAQWYCLIKHGISVLFALDLLSEKS